jgi:DNA-binding transcriptional ArsR family regulator
MAETGKTTIQHYRTTTAAAAPIAGNLTAGELASHFPVSRPTMSAHFAVLREADLIDAFSQISKECPDTMLFIVGPGRLMDSLNLQIQRLNLTTCLMMKLLQVLQQLVYLLLVSKELEQLQLKPKLEQLIL